MYIEFVSATKGKDGQGYAVVRWDGRWNVDSMETAVRENKLTWLAFGDSEFFDDRRKAVSMCEILRTLDIKILWSARLAMLPSDGLLRAMRLAGCQYVDMQLASDLAVEALKRARRYGFDIRIRNEDGTPYVADRILYSVAEREAVADRLAGLHSAQFDLAVAYYKARRFNDVMLPLGKAMTLGFPMNVLCLNLLACLSAAKHYPDQAAGLLDQARNGCPHPVVFRNRELLKSWLESGGDLKGVRLDLEPGQTAFFSTSEFDCV